MKNFSFIFVKDYNEYILYHDRVRITNKKFSDAIKELVQGHKSDVAAYFTYRAIVSDEHRKHYFNHKEVHHGEIFGDTGIDGLKMDFNFGLRLDVPEGDWHIKISDYESGHIFFEHDVSDMRLIASEGYYIHWQIEVSKDGEKVFEHTFDPAGQDVLVAFLTGTMGDTLAILPYVEEFKRRYNCNMKVYLPQYMNEVVKNFFPHLELVNKITYDYYATYYPSLYMGDIFAMPVDCRTIPLELTGKSYFGLHHIVPMPKFTPTKKRKIKQPYVCIAVQASGLRKTWLYPGGWDIVVDYLKSLGYRVICIDKHKVETGDGYKMAKPKGAEDFTGNLPLMNRANMLYYADFFIGSGSGLAWLAHYVGCKVIMISGFSQDWCEFDNPYRISNRFVCNGCYNDIDEMYSKKVCLQYAGTERELECHKKISPRQVIRAIDRLIADKKET